MHLPDGMEITGEVEFTFPVINCTPVSENSHLILETFVEPELFNVNVLFDALFVAAKYAIGPPLHGPMTIV